MPSGQCLQRPQCPVRRDGRSTVKPYFLLQFIDDHHSSTPSFIQRSLPRIPAAGGPGSSSWDSPSVSQTVSDRVLAGVRQKPKRPASNPLASARVKGSPKSADDTLGFAGGRG